MLVFVLSGCFGELFASRTVYLATEYRIEHPRIVAMALDPPRVEPDHQYTLEWLLLAPRGGDLGGYSLETCALGRDVVTYIGDLNCFQDPGEIVRIAEGTGNSLQFTPPPTPEIDECGVIWWDSGGWDSGSSGTADTGLDRGGNTCAHELPLVLEGSVDEQPVFAAGWVSWNTKPVDTEFPTSLRSSRIDLDVPESAGAGETIEVTLSVEGDLRGADFLWYVDDGVLEDTGWTIAHGYVEDDAAWPEGLTSTTNRWTLPEQGTPRVAVVVVFNGREGVSAPDNHWVVQTVEVR